MATTELAADSSALADAPVGDPLAPAAALKTSGQLPSGQPGLPPVVTFKRGEFSFNRRFFETKLAGFQKVVPSNADKDMVVFVKSLRGEFVGRRITQINANDLHLQTFSANATADETIPFTEILEVQIRHKDIV